MKKSIITTIIIIIIAIIAFGNATYSYFAADIDLGKILNTEVLFSGTYNPVFTAVSDGDLILKVTDADMLHTDTNLVAATKSQTITVTLDDVGDSAGSTASCNYKFIFKDLSSDSSTEEKTYEKYVPSSLASGQNEFTIKITNNAGDVITETKVNDLTNDQVLKDGLTITAQGVAKSEVYTVTATIYNLNADQDDIKNKTYGYKILTQAYDCKVDKNG